MRGCESLLKEKILRQRNVGEGEEKRNWIWRVFEILKEKGKVNVESQGGNGGKV